MGTLWRHGDSGVTSRRPCDVTDVIYASSILQGHILRKTLACSITFNTFTTLILLPVFIRESQVGHPIGSALVLKISEKIGPSSPRQNFFFFLTFTHELHTTSIMQVLKYTFIWLRLHNEYVLLPQTDFPFTIVRIESEKLSHALCRFNWFLSFDMDPIYRYWKVRIRNQWKLFSDQQ